MTHVHMAQSVQAMPPPLMLMHFGVLLSSPKVSASSFQFADRIPSAGDKQEEGSSLAHFVAVRLFEYCILRTLKFWCLRKCGKLSNKVFDSFKAEILLIVYSIPCVDMAVETTCRAMHMTCHDYSTRLSLEKKL